MPSVIMLLFICAGVLSMGPSIRAAVQPCDGPLPMLSQQKLNVIDIHMQNNLDDYTNTRINSDQSGEIQNNGMICVNPLNPNEVAAVWQDYRFGYPRVGVGYSTDAGQSWHDDVFPQMYYQWQTVPVLTVDAEGTFIAMMLTQNPTHNPSENGLLTLRSTDGGRNWKDSLFAVNGDPVAYEDKGALVVDRSGSSFTGSQYCVWTRFYSYPEADSSHIAFISKPPGSDHFARLTYISQTSLNQWANAAVGNEGEIYISWVNAIHQGIMFSRSTDGGQNFSPEQVIASTQFSYAFISDSILVFPYGAMAVDETEGSFSNRLYLVYTDMLPDSSETDIWLIYSNDGGTNWSQRQRMNDDHESYAVDQFHPWVTVDPLGRVWVAFYDRRNDPDNNLADIYFTVSTDGGQTWRPNERVTSESFDPQPGISTAGVMGDYIGLCASDLNAHIVWTDTRLGDHDVFGAVLDSSVFLSIEPFIREIQLPAALTLTAFPNPGNSTISLIYDLPQSGTVGLILYNIQGRQVWSLPKSFASAGMHEVKLDLSKFATGLYIARLNSSGGAAHTKLLLTK